MSFVGFWKGSASAHSSTTSREPVTSIGIRHAAIALLLLTCADRLVADEPRIRSDGQGCALEKAGNRAGALVNVGLAMHTLQDNTSPAHMVIQEFDPGRGNLSGPTVAHVRDELDDPSGMPQKWGLGENLDRATCDAYAHFANAAGLPVPPVPQCDGKPCFKPSGEIHVEVPSQ